MKKRILMVNECSVLNTGYSVYGKEILNRFYETQDYTVGELACYISANDPRISDIQWHIYPNLPDNESQNEIYQRHPSNQFGEWKFESVCLDFKPHIVFDIRDFWMCEFEERSPYNRLFHWALMPTVDAMPQNEQWLATFSNADAIFTYSDWAKKLLFDETNGIISPISSAPPSAAMDFKPLSYEERQHIKSQFGLDNFTIFGTVMRNQRRKLYPELFAAFRKFLDKTKRTDVLLYCHTSFPDMGWDIPKLILEYGLSTKILFTYICRNCTAVTPKFFSDALTVCHSCGQNSMNLTNVQIGVNNTILNEIYNIFDLYIQAANSEGFGMPQLESAAAGTPIMSTDYSAMSDVVRKLNGTPIPYIHLETEVETGCKRAIPDINFMAQFFEQYLNKSRKEKEEIRRKTRLSFEQNYSTWDDTFNIWKRHFDSIDIEKYERAWSSPPRIHYPNQQIPTNLNNSDFVEWVITEVLGEPEQIGSFMSARMLRDLNYGSTTGGIAGYYFNDNSINFQRPTYYQFNRETAYRAMVDMCNKRNYWEKLRCQS